MAGRPKTFDHNHLLDQAVSLFWRQGFQGTSIRDVANAANVTTGTLYNEFGGKENLYAAALGRYFTQVVKPRVDDILLTQTPTFLDESSQDSGFARIHYFLTSGVHDLPESMARQACLLINTTNELGQGDSPIHHEIDKANDYIGDALRALLLKESSKPQDIRAIHIEQQLLQIHVFMTGLMITAKHVEDTHALIPTIDAFIEQLKLSA